MTFPVPPIEPPPKPTRKWDKHNRLGLLIIAVVCAVSLSINQYWRMKEANTLRQRAANIGLLIPEKWQTDWENGTSDDPYFVSLQAHARANQLQIMIGKLDFPYLAVELIAWESKIERFELGVTLLERAKQLGFTEFPNLHLPTNPQHDPVNSLQVWQEMIAESENNESKLANLKTQGEALSIHTEYWLPPFSNENIEHWKKGMEQTKHYQQELAHYYTTAKLLGKQLPKVKPPYTEKIREEIHLLVRIWQQQKTLLSWAAQNEIDVNGLYDSLANCQKPNAPCDPRWNEQPFFSYTPKDQEFWSALGVTNPQADSDYFELHALDANQAVYWFLLMHYNQQKGFINNAPAKIEHFSWNNQAKIKQLQLQQDIQSSNGPPKEFHQ